MILRSIGANVLAIPVDVVLMAASDTNAGEAHCVLALSSPSHLGHHGYPLSPVAVGLPGARLFVRSTT